jgi:hypothetical protein
MVTVQSGGGEVRMYTCYRCLGTGYDPRPKLVKLCLDSDFGDYYKKWWGYRAHEVSEGHRYDQAHHDDYYRSSAFVGKP